MTSHVFHFTSAKHLRAIVASGELRLSKRTVHPPLLWATTSPRIEKGATGLFDGWGGSLKLPDWRIVRFTLRDEGFVPWLEEYSRAYTPEEFEEAAWLVEPKYVKSYRAERWRCRRDPLPLREVIACHVWMNDPWQRPRWRRAPFGSE